MSAACICGQSNQSQQQSIVCNNCHRYIHLECANLLLHQAKEIYIYYCQFCKPYTGPSVSKTITNVHRNDRNEENADMLPVQAGTPDFVSFLKRCTAFSEPRSGEMRVMRGQQLTLKELVISGFEKPILVETKDGLELSVEQFSLDRLLQYYPADFWHQAVEVTRQIKVRVRLTYLIQQFSVPPSERQDVFMISLDLSQNDKLNSSFVPPRIVRKLSWVDQYWPELKPFKPLLSKYCFISMEHSYTDFHIDLGGASAWYHIIQGEQIFFLIEPTKCNLKAFGKWVKLSNPKEIMFFTKAEKVFKTKVSSGQTIFIPNGWIYAVLSTQDTISFGGYFLHSLSMATQIYIHDFLDQLNMAEFCFPSYELSTWFAAPNIIKLVKDSFKNQPPKHLSEGIEALIEKLRQWVHKAKSKKNDAHAKEKIPNSTKCSKIIRDLNHCLRCSKRKPTKDNKGEKKRVIMSTSAIASMLESKPEQPLEEECYLPPNLKPEEARIKDLVKQSSSNKSEAGSALKVTFNMKIAQDVIRRSLDDPYDMNNEHNDRELRLEGGGSSSSGGKTSKSKKKKRHKERDEITKMIEGRPQDENYIYLDIETPEENKAAIMASNDKIWEPGASGKKTKPKVKKMSQTPSGSKPKLKLTTSSSATISSSSSSTQDGTNNKQVSITTTTTTTTIISSGPSTSSVAVTSSANYSVDQAADKVKRYKKGLATPKQRLAKKLKMSR